jgi:hypothetical protein
MRRIIKHQKYILLLIFLLWNLAKCVTMTTQFKINQYFIKKNSFWFEKKLHHKSGNNTFKRTLWLRYLRVFIKLPSSTVTPQWTYKITKHKIAALKRASVKKPGPGLLDRYANSANKLGGIEKSAGQLSYKKNYN